MRLSSLWAQEPTASPSLYRGKRRPRKLGSRTRTQFREAPSRDADKKEPETTTTLLTTKSNLLGSVGGGGG